MQRHPGKAVRVIPKQLLVTLAGADNLALKLGAVQTVDQQIFVGGVEPATRMRLSIIALMVFSSQGRSS
jgi:hypothetical protein